MSKATGLNGLRLSVQALMQMLRKKADKDEIVTSINGVTPDDAGNISVEIPEGFSGSWSDLTEKPFYSELEQVLRSSVSIGIYNLGYATLPYEFFPADGEQYTVIWDSTSYECAAVTTAVDDKEATVVGNTTFFGGNENTDIPFGIISRSGRTLVYSNESGEHNIEISGNECVPHKIPREYVDYNPIVGVIDSSYYNYRYLNPERGASIAEVRKAAAEGVRDIIIRLDLDNWQGTLRYMGLINASTDGSNYASALLFSTIKANNVTINDSDEVINGTMQLEYWYAMLEPTEGPPADAFVNLQFSEINLAPGASKTGYVMQVNEEGFWEAAETPSSLPTPTTAAVGQTLVVKAVDENGKPTEWECVDVEEELPTITASDAGKFLRVSTDGKWVAESIANAEGASF